MDRHAVVNAILYQLKNGSQWRDLPGDLPKWQTVYSQLRRWKIGGVWDEVLRALAQAERARHKKRIPDLVVRRFYVRQKYGDGEA